MAAPSLPVPSPPGTLHPSGPSQVPTSAGVKSEISLSETRESPSAASSKSLEPTPNAPTAITVPSYSRWFSWGEIHETERRILPMFFDGKSPSKNSRVYKYYRDSIIGRFREDPTRKITFTEVRRGLVGDIGSVRRVFDFLESWGLINYTASTGKQGSKDEKEKRGAPLEEGLEKKESAPKKLCTSCKTACSLYCFATDKADIMLCAKCYVRSNYRAGLTSADFKRVDIGVGMDAKLKWTDKETLHLLEAVLQFGDDWQKVAEHVGGGRSEKECALRFIKLPFGEQFMGSLGAGVDGGGYGKIDQADVNTDTGGENTGGPSPRKRMHLTPLADASNPIMAQVAFLSAMVGKEVAEAAAQAAVAALYELDQAPFDGTNGRKIGLTANKLEEVDVAANDLAKDMITEARSQLDKEQQDMERSISDILDVQMKGIKEKIVRFEEMELLMEKERLQLQFMKSMLFEDQLNILQQSAQLSSLEGKGKEKIRAPIYISANNEAVAPHKQI